MPVALGVNGGVLGSNNLPTATTYKGIFTPNEVARAIALGFWPINKSQAVTGVFGAGVVGSLTVGSNADEYFEYTTLLLPANGTNGAQNNTFLDGSTNNFTITRNGNTTQGTFSPFSQTGWGNYFSGTSGQYLNTVANAAFNFGTSDFTVEAWVYPGTSIASVMPIVEIRTSASNATGFAFFRYPGALYLSVFSQSAIIGNSTNNLTQNTWNHVALVRSGNTWTFYINGVSSGSFTWASAQSDGATTGPKIGGSTTAGEVWVGYLSNVRIVKGVAVYTGNFTPPTSPLTATQSAGTNISAITGTQTSLLTCQSNRFVDNSVANSGTGFAITVNGSPSVQAFSPFNPTSSWSAATNGGSGYFDGSGDYLSVADNAAFDLAANNFTIECWAYTETFASQYNVLICQWNADPYSFIFRITPSLIGLYTYTGSVQNYTVSVTNTTGQWNHFAVTRNSGTLTFYKNGESVGTTAISGTISNSSANMTVGVIGDLNANTFHKGYISGLRLINGSAVAPTITSPPTNITNTSLLLNFTNAGIYDATSKNDLETVGDAKISTAQSKWGSGSMYFDGTGDYLLTPSSQLLNYGSGSFTFEGWFYVSSYPAWGAIATVIANRANVSVVGGNFLLAVTNQTSSNKIKIWASSNGSSHDIFNEVDVATGLSTNTWFHLAIVRSGNTWYGFVNGSQTWTTTSSSTLYSNSLPTTIGADTNGNGFTGYIQDLRITKGYARYTSNFTAPTAAFPTL